VCQKIPCLTSTKGLVQIEPVGKQIPKAVTLKITVQFQKKKKKNSVVQVNIKCTITGACMFV
jgi:hypothetical protein